MDWISLIIEAIRQGIQYNKEAKEAGVPKQERSENLFTGEFLVGEHPLPFLNEDQQSFATSLISGGLSDLFGGTSLFTGVGSRASSRRKDARTNLIHSQFQELLGRAPTIEEFDIYNNAIKSEEIESPDELRSKLKEDFDIQDAADSGLGTLSEMFDMFKPPSEKELIKKFKNRYKAIGDVDIIPRTEMDFINRQRTQLNDFVLGVRSGTIAPEVTDPAQRERLITDVKETFSRELAASQKAELETLSRRGILPSIQTGVSGPAESILAQRRAEVFEDPLTSFIRNLDIQTEEQRVRRQQQLNDLALQTSERLLASGEDIGKFLASAKGDLLRNISGESTSISNIAANFLSNALGIDLGHAELEESKRKTDLANELALAQLGGIAREPDLSDLSGILDLFKKRTRKFTPTKAPTFETPKFQPSTVGFKPSITPESFGFGGDNFGQFNPLTSTATL